MFDIARVQHLLEIVGNTQDPVSKNILGAEEKELVVKTIITELDVGKLAGKELEQCLELLRVLCREPFGSQPFFSENTIQTLIRYSYLNEPTTEKLSLQSTVNVLKCLANIQSMDSGSRQIFAKSDCAPHLLLALQLEKIPTGTMFLLLRLLFFVTAIDSSFAKLYVEQGILETLAKIISNLRDKEYPEDTWMSEEVVLNEALKIAFNVTIDRTRITSSMFGTGMNIEEIEDGPQVQRFRNLLQEVIRTNLRFPIGQPAMGPPHLHIINCLVNFPFEPLSDVWLPGGSLAFPKQLVQILKDTVTLVAPEKGEEDVEETMFGYPIDNCMLMALILLKKISLNKEARAFLKGEMMPHDIDRSKPLNKGASFTAGLVRIMTSVRLLQTRDFLCDLLVTLCDGNSEYFVRYFGYGNTAGYLFNHGLLGAAPTGPATSDIGDNIDPITGSVAEEKQDPWAGMTEEEKERESERLFVLFDRLQKNGVIKMVPKQ